MVAFISGGVTISKSALDMEAVRRDLTIKHWTMGEKEPYIVYGYTQTKTTITVPRAYGLKLISECGIESSTETTRGVAVRFPREVKHEGKYAYQQDFVDRIFENTERRSDFLVHAATGKGKTVCALSVAQRRGRATLVVVDQENLMHQWRDECQNALGLRPDQIGTVQGPVCSYRGKSVTVAMVQTLVSREFDERFLNQFGTVIFDEVHTVGAPTFSRALLMFPAEVRFGVSATIDRGDDLQKLLHYNLGQVEVSLLDKHDKSYVYFIENPTVYSWYANISPKTGRILSEVSEDGYRNNTIVQAIGWLYGDQGRDTLVIGDRIEQLENLMAMCAYAGIPEEDMGLYCGFRNVWKFAPDPRPRRRPVGYEKGTEYTPVFFGRVRKRRTKKELDCIKANSKIIFATFGMFAKGVDVPRLSAGMDVTPRSKSQQVHGRILRVQEDKLVPLWVTIRDTQSYRLEYQFANRVEEYAASSAEIYEWHLENGVRSWGVKELARDARTNSKALRALNIETRGDGCNMLTTPPTPSAPSRHR